MCLYIGTRCSSKFKIAYKVAMKVQRGENKFDYLSPAMGITYRKNGMIKVCDDQKCLSGYYCPCILSMEGTYEAVYVGRTGAYIRCEDARYVKNRIKGYSHSDIYEPVILKVKLSKALLWGSFNDLPIILGRHMKIMGEV